MMERGTSTIMTPFTSEAGGFKYEYQATHLAGMKKPSFISFNVTKDNMRVATGNMRPADGYFQFETLVVITDDERNTIYAKVASDKTDVMSMAEKTTISIVE